MNDRHAVRKLCEERGLFHRGVAAAYHNQRFALEEEPVTGRASRNAVAAQSLGRRRFAGNAEPLRRSASGNDQRLSFDYVILGLECEGSLAQLRLAHPAYKELCSKTLGLPAELVHKYGTHYSVRETRIVFDIGCDHQLAARFWTFNHQRLEVRSRGVDCSGQTRGSRAKNHDLSMHRLFRHKCSPKSFH